MFFEVLAQKYSNKVFLVVNLGNFVFHQILKFGKFEVTYFKYHNNILRF